MHCRIALFAALLATLPASAKDWFRYPAISPDGETIVFTSGADLYSVPSGGGRAVQLTQNARRDFMPIWSPDGSKIAFASDRGGNYDVYIIPAQGGVAQQVTWHSAHDYPSAFAADGKSLYFESTRVDAIQSLDIPNRRMSELYQIDITDLAEPKEPSQVFSIPAESLSVRGKRFLYHDRKGYEDPWRKRHQSSVTRDVWRYDGSDGSHTKLTTFAGEDRNPVWLDDKTFLYLSERGGTFNIWQQGAAPGAEPKQITRFDQHPVRFLTRADGGKLCFGYDGSIYILADLEAEPQKVAIELIADAKTTRESVHYGKDITEMKVSPDGKEIAFIARGEVFVTSVGHGTTRRITDTPQQERSLDFAPNGRTLYYASERDGSWNLYSSTIAREDDEHFYLATIVNEQPVLVGEDETFQPDISPDGESVAFLKERTQLVVMNLKTKAQTTIHDGSRSYSYTDGDITFAWSPDSQHLLTMLLQKDRWTENIVMFAADGSGEAIDISKSGYYDLAPTWGWKGEAAVWVSNRHGQKAHGSWGYEMDVYVGFLTNRAYRLYHLSEEERETYDDDAWKEEWKEKKELKPALVDQRIERLTIHSTDLQAYAVDPDGGALYYVISDRDELQLWKQDFYNGDTKKLAGLGSGEDVQMQISGDGETLFLLAGGSLSTVKTSDGSKEGVGTTSEMRLDLYAEREEIYDHIWRQTREKFHRPDFHGVDWDFYGQHYRQFLPSIDNNYDFTEMLSELLGELDASHTGAFYRPRYGAGADTASLGILIDPAHDAAGIKIAEILDRSPLALVDVEIPAGSIITAINGEEIPARANLARLLDRLTGKRTLLTIQPADGGDAQEVVIRPISFGEQSELLYQRWIARMRAETARLSDGQIGYVHVRQMNDSGFRTVFNDVFGRYSDARSIVVDTRFNGGGWLTEDLTTFLSGEEFLKFYPRGQKGMGGEPLFRWAKPSAVIMGEGNYSDAHIFPYAYKTLGIGKLVGMPVPGTGTAVWWEYQVDPTIVFGIPQVSTIDTDGNYLENTQLEPDIKIANTPEDRAAGRDKQLEKAVEHLLSLPEAKEWPFPPVK